MYESYPIPTLENLHLDTAQLIQNIIIEYKIHLTTHYDHDVNIQPTAVSKIKQFKY